VIKYETSDSGAARKRQKYCVNVVDGAIFNALLAGQPGSKRGEGVS
jgi:hypothetical protein